MNLNKWRTVAVSAPMYAALKQMADENDRSVSKQVAHILKKFLNRRAKYRLIVDRGSCITLQRRRITSYVSPPHDSRRA